MVFFELGPGDTIKATHPVDKGVFSIGTDANCDVRLRGRGIMDVHAHVQVQGRVVVIESVGDKFVVNGRRTDRHQLQQGDILDFGTVRLRFHAGPRTRDSGVRSGVGGGAGLLSSLARFSEALAETYEIDRLLETMLDTIIDVTQAARGAVLLLKDGKIQPTAARTAGGKTAPLAGLAISDSIVDRVLQSRHSIVVSDALSDREFKAAQSVLDFHICSVLCTPLQTKGELLGVIYLGNDNVVNLFTEESREVATVFAAQAAMAVKSAIVVQDLQLTNQSLTAQIERMNFGSLIGASDSMKELFKRVDKVAATDINVLITGETGTGKELVANELHRRSPRARGPFVALNCGAIPENLLESELFGHVRGAFTGAVATREGKFAAADGGTLFLDEVGEMPVALQVKLLRVLEDRRVTRVGEHAPRDIDIRVVAATNRNLSQEVKAGKFREDLYYRLNVVRLELPALRDRGEDVVLLARYFLRRYSEEMNVRARGFADDAVRAMQLHQWPGNIRELENRIKKALVFCDGGVISAEDLELGALQTGKIEPLVEAKETFAASYVRKILAINGDNRAQTAKDLGVDVRTIYRYLQREREEDDAD
ncbi:MAG: sigma 54-interacting transcriptional regulator [Deltaproteobacteria bacterium]|nr:sigma 54-interacting transcriptional regulator [Deltaproteobacteria bacterium]